MTQSDSALKSRFGPLIARVHESGTFLKGGFERSTHWAHTTTALFVFTSDFLKPIIPHCTLWVLIFALALLLVVRLAVKFEKLSRELGWSIVVFCLITALLAIGMLGLEKKIGDERGTLAALIPGLEGLQEQLFNIDAKLDAVKKDSEALRKGQEEEKARNEEMHKEVMRALGALPALQAEKELRKVLRPQVPGIDDVRTEKLAGVVQEILEAAKKSTVRPEDFIGTVEQALTDA